ncbi:hypothetical protein F4778DRAFT_55561 [Xylariomycetidae sp. FL2044]|nr:hypothetical protein F4778DRAFT_55561 [Xylariomycetidae sp. FL2044]
MTTGDESSVFPCVNHAALNFPVSIYFQLVEFSLFVVCLSYLSPKIRSLSLPNSIESSSMASSVPAVLDAIQADAFSSDAERFVAKEAARRLVLRLETPFEHFWTLAFEAPPLIAGLQMCQDLNLWPEWTKKEKLMPGIPQKLGDLLGMCNAKVEPNLLRE